MNAPLAAEERRSLSNSERQVQVVGALKALLPAHALLWTQEETTPYECDGLTAYRQRPLAVALPETEAQVQAVLQACHELGVPVVARGAGTGLSGGALPHGQGVTLSLAKFNRIVAIDPAARTAVVQCGVRNLAISEAAGAYGLYYAPDPSSQIACTIGGNVAENSGGVHCLKYGLTYHNVLKVRGFTAEGEPVQFGGDALDVPGLDLLSLVIGSEGMLAVTLEVTVKLIPKPQLARCIMASFDDVRKAGDAVAAVIAGGIIPAGLEMMDKPMTAAVEDFVRAGYDLGAEAILLCESDGTPEEVEEEIGRMSAVLNRCGATRIAVSRDEAERLKFWSGRKNAFPASGRISPDYMCMDSTIPRKRLADILLAIQQMEQKYRLKCANVFHAGDGNLHPLILFDANDADQLHRCELFGADILETSVAMGGTITGEHGVGIEKLNSMCVQFSAEEREQMLGVKRAFDEKGLLNPGKVIPTLVRCAEYGKVLVRGGKPAHPELPRFSNMRTSAIAELIDRIRGAAASRTPLCIRGGGSKDFYGAQIGTPRGEPLSTLALSGIVSYEPSELVVTVAAGTSLAELEAALAEKNQCLPFEPPHFGDEQHRATVGGLVAAGLSGPARASVGAVRDYVLGAKLVNGRGELLTFGGQVMKNVAGYDVSRVLVGSLGVLGVVAEVSLKVLPKASGEATLKFELGQAEALTRLNEWGGQPLPLNASCWIEDGGIGTLYLRLRGAAAAVRAACSRLGGERIDDAQAASDWADCREQRLPWFTERAADQDLWRLSVPQTAPALDFPEPPLVEWHGGQRWARAASGDEETARRLRATAASVGGSAILFIANNVEGKSASTRFGSIKSPLDRIQQALKREFDPDGIFNPGRLSNDF